MLNWFRPDVIELEKRVANLEHALILTHRYYEQRFQITNENFQAMERVLKQMAQAIVDTMRPFPGSTQN